MSTLTKKSLYNAANRTDAKCMDGSVPAYFYAPGSATTSPRKVVVYFMHGGFCGRSHDECAQWVPYFTSLYLPPTIQGHLHLSNDAVENPAFHTYDKVFIDYCSGDIFQAQGQGTSSTGVQLYYHGFNIVKYLAEDLKNGHILSPQDGVTPNVGEIILSGSSAGGIAVTNHAWRFQQLFPTTNIRAIIDSSQFFTIGGETEILAFLNPLLPPPSPTNATASTRTTSMCEHHPTGQKCCIYAQCIARNSKYYSVPTFWIQSKYDPYSMVNQISFHSQMAAHAEGLGLQQAPSPSISSYALDFSSLAGKIRMLNDDLVINSPASGALISTCTEHVLFCPTNLKFEFFGFDHLDAGTGGVEAAFKTISTGKIENPMSGNEDLAIQVKINAGLKRESNLVNGLSITEHVTKWANGDADYMGKVISRLNAADINAKDESCDATMQMDFSGLNSLEGTNAMGISWQSLKDAETVISIMIGLLMVFILLIGVFFYCQRLRLRLTGHIHILIATSGGKRNNKKEDSRDEVAEQSRAFAQKVLQQRASRITEEALLSLFAGKGKNASKNLMSPSLMMSSPIGNGSLDFTKNLVVDTNLNLLDDGENENQNQNGDVNGNMKQDGENENGNEKAVAAKAKLNLEKFEALPPARRAVIKMKRALAKHKKMQKDMELTKMEEAKATGMLEGEKAGTLAVPGKTLLEDTSQRDVSKVVDNHVSKTHVSKAGDLHSSVPQIVVDDQKRSPNAFGSSDKSENLLFVPNLPCMLLHNVTYKIGNSHLLLVNINACFAYGRMVALMGGSGSGKSTLCKLASDRQLEGTYSGSITLDGTPIHLVENRTAKIGFVRQFPACGPEDCYVTEALLLHAYKAGLDIFDGVPLGDAVKMHGLGSKDMKKKYSVENVEALRRHYEAHIQVGGAENSEKFKSGSGLLGSGIIGGVEDVLGGMRGVLGGGLAKSWGTLAGVVGGAKKEDSKEGREGKIDSDESSSNHSGINVPVNVFSKIQQLIKELNMGWFLHRRIKDLSGGQKKLLSVAQALITEPGILFLDEPTSGLDAMTAEMLMLALSNVTFKTKCCMVVVIHQPAPLIYSLFDDVFLLCRGKLIYSGARELADQTLDRMDRELTARERKRKAMKNSASVEPVQDDVVPAQGEAIALEDEDHDATENPDATLAKAMNLFKAPTRKWDFLKHALTVPRATSADEFIQDELKLIKKNNADEVEEGADDNTKEEKITCKRAIDGADPAPGKAALLIELFAYNNLTLGCLPLVLIPGGAIIVWGFLDSNSPKHDTAKVMLEVYVTGFALLNLLLPDIFSHLNVNIDCMQDRVFRGVDMFWILQFYSQLMTTVLGLVMGSIAMTAYLLPEQSMTNCTWGEHVIVGYLISSFIAMLTQLCMFWSRGHENSAKMASVFTLLAVVTAGFSLFSGFTINLSEAGWLTPIILLSPPFWAQKKLVVTGFLDNGYNCEGLDCLMNSGNSWIAMLYGDARGEEAFITLVLFLILGFLGCRWAWYMKMSTPAVEVLLPQPGQDAKSVALFPTITTSNFGALLTRLKEKRLLAEKKLGALERRRSDSKMNSKSNLKNGLFPKCAVSVDNVDVKVTDV